MGSDGCAVPNGRPESGGGRRPGGLFAVVDIGDASAVGVSGGNGGGLRADRPRRRYPAGRDGTPGEGISRGSVWRRLVSASIVRLRGYLLRPISRRAVRAECPIIDIM